MNTEIQKYGYSEEEYKLIKEKICQGAPDNEIAFFCKIAQLKRLNPFSGQICLIPRKSKQKNKFGDEEWITTYTVQTQVAGLRAIADRTGNYSPAQIPTKFEVDENNNLVSATAFVKKYAGNEWHTIAETAYWDEFVKKYKDQKTKEYKVSSMWSEKPRLMLGKCAESLALRKAFPDELSGLYTIEEYSPNDIDNIVHVEINNDNQVLNSQYDASNDTRIISEAQLRRLHKIASDNGISSEDIKSYIATKGYESSKDIKRCDYEDICNYAQSKDKVELNKGPVNESPWGQSE